MRFFSLRRLGILLLLILLVLVGGYYWQLPKRLAQWSKPIPAMVQLPVTPLRPRPILGAHFNFADPPNALIFTMVSRPAELAAALHAAGIEDLRMSFHGYYSHMGVEATAKLKEETKLTNKFPWFPIETYISFIKRYNFTTVLGLNVEEGTDSAIDLLTRFQRAQALHLITSVEFGNESFLSPRPWPPEEYSEKCVAIMQALRPFKVKFAISLIIGKVANLPTKMSGDEYCERTLRRLAELIDLRQTTDLLGVIHLYSRGVRPLAIDQLNQIVRKYSAMKYQVTEYNIRLSLQGNPHLTNAYAMEFASKLNRLMVNPDILGLWIHSFPYHSLNYWTNGREATVIARQDEKLSGDDWRAGWHLTPAGRVHRFYREWAWNGELLAFLDLDALQYWAVVSPHKGTLVSVLNDRFQSLDQIVEIAGQQLQVHLAPHTLACYDLTTGKQVATLALP
jgi:hypothetical protein